MKFVLILLVVVFAVGIMAKRENYTGRQRLVGYWGQNAAGPSNGPANYEKSLAETCRTTKFDIIAVGFVSIFYDSRNKGNLPSLNLAYHCDEEISPQYPFLFRCPTIEEGIKECQGLGKKVIMSVGGPTGDGTLQTPAKARELAETLYDLFLGGSRKDGSLDLRPFGSAVMDGIDLHIENGLGDHYGDFIRAIRSLMDADQSKVYLLTAAPHCKYPDQYLGPGGQSGLEVAGEGVDHLYIQFYDSDCKADEENGFLSALKEWLAFSKSKSPRGPLIFVGVPAATGAINRAQHYRSPAELKTLYQKVGDLPGIGGIMLWDVSWDQNNVNNKRRYSDLAFSLLKDSNVVPTKSTTTSETDLCATAGDGVHANPDDCSKYIVCYGGQRRDKSCKTGFLFNDSIGSCDFAVNVQC